MTRAVTRELSISKRSAPAPRFTRIDEPAATVIRIEGELSVSRVTLRPIDERECREYWATGEPRDKAGGYAVQGLAAVFIERIEGSYSGVMGLPLFETARLLARAGVHHWSGGAG